MPTEPELKVTTPDQWNTNGQTSQDVGFITELPSGNVIRMRRTMDMLDLLRTGQIPNPLAGIVQKMIDTQSMDFPAKEADTQVAQQLLELLDRTWMKAVLEPAFDAPPVRGIDAIGMHFEETHDQWIQRIARWEPSAGKISVTAVDVNDKMFVFVVAQGAAADLARFREGQDAALDAVQAVPRVPKPTKRTGGAGTGKRKK